MIFKKFYFEYSKFRSPLVVNFNYLSKEVIYEFGMYKV